MELIMEAKASHRLARVSARKARLVADLIRNKPVGEVLDILKFVEKKSAGFMRAVVESAVANAEYQAQRENARLDVDELYVKQVLVDQGPTLRRFRPRARGMATKVLKKTSHITVVVGAGEV